MSQTQYDIYRSSNIALIRTMVIKSELTAEAVNTGLGTYGIAVDSTDPSSWKYYLNLAGEYHPTDRPMTILSLDTLQTIDFTKENLQLHDSTRREYSKRSRYYDDLLARFPDQESLINGILRPIDLTTAIQAPDGRILDYDHDLIEDNEENLIILLQQWIDRFNIRWHNKSYAISDDLYAAAQLGILFQLLPSVVMTIRVQNCHTNYTHSYHIKSFLASQGGLDVFIDYLTKKQALWLYRNIRYIHRNAGKRATFKELIQHILTDRGFPLAQWSMRHNLDEMIDALVPRIEFERRPLNLGYSSAGLDTRDIPHMLDDEAVLAKGNPEIQLEAETKIRIQMENANQDRLSTKILESSILDMTDASPYTLSDALLNHWLYFAERGQYTAIVTVDNPRTGGTYQFTMLDAFAVFLYTYNKVRGITLPHIPTIEAWMVRRLPTPTRTELWALIEKRFDRKALVDAALLNLPPVGMQYVSTAMFNDTVTEIHNALLGHRMLYASREHVDERGQTENMILRFYRDYTCHLGGEVDYHSWFVARGLDIEAFSPLECDLLATQLLERCTGADLKKTKSLKEIQAAMLRLMGQLSSYSIQFLQQINSQPIVTVEWPMIRVGDDTVHGYVRENLEVLNENLLDFKFHGKTFEAITHEEIGPGFETQSRGHHRDDLNIELDWGTTDDINIHERLETNPATLINFHATERSLFDATDLTTMNYTPITLTPLAEGLGITGVVSGNLTPTDVSENPALA